MNYSLQPVPVTYAPVAVPATTMPLNPPALEMPQVNPVQPVPMTVTPVNPVDVVKPLPTYAPQQQIRKEEELDIMNILINLSPKYFELIGGNKQILKICVKNIFQQNAHWQF